MDQTLNSVVFLNQITSVVPCARQIALQKMEYYNFIHFGLNTFTRKEWGNGKVKPSAFQIRDIDTDEWVRQLKSTGSTGIIFTAKHHDGFCLFPSAYTDYTIAATNYQNGKGDLVKQLADSCKRHGMKFGIYLSPWDRHEASYGTEQYNDFFCGQLTELCTNYGELFCLWFDGACGEGKNGKRQAYAWERYFEIIRRLQPDAVISNCGPDVRWIGNEHGIARKSEFSVVPKALQDQLHIAQSSQQKAGAGEMLKHLNFTDRVLGERGQLVGEELCWYPAEMNIPITYIGWFWRPLFEHFFTRSARNLAKCWYASVGGNATLLVNVPPNDKGRLPEKYIRRLLRAKSRISKRLQHRIPVIKTEELPHGKRFYFAGGKLRTVVLSEELARSQRIEAFHLEVNHKVIYSGTTVGYQKICLLKRAVKNCTQLDVIIDSCRNEPHLSEVSFYQ